MVSIRKRTWNNKSGKHTAYEITYVIDGKQCKKGGYASLIDAQIDLPNVVQSTTENIKFGKLAQRYIDNHCVLVCKESTKHLYQSYLNNYLSKLKIKLLNDIKKSDIDSVILDLKNKGLSNKVINCVICYIKAVFNYGMDNDYINKNIMTRFKTLPLVKKQIKSFNEKQQEVFLELAKQSKYYAFFAVALLTGMRISEIAGLEWSDIDFKRNIISVNKQIYRKTKISTKNKKCRVIDMSNNLAKILLEHKNQNTYLTKLVFHNGSGEPVHTCSLKENYFHPLIKKCNEVLDADNQIEDFRFHDLRHTHATYLLSNGVPIKYVQERLGHCSAKMTLDIYASFMPSVKYGALDLLDNISKNNDLEHKKNTENSNPIKSIV